MLAATLHSRLIRVYAQARVLNKNGGDIYARSYKERAETFRCDDMCY